MSKVTCIDVSCWQVGVNYNKVKSAGITAVIIRAGYGRETSQKDKQFETHYKNAKAAGLKVGAYWYSYAESVADAKKEASACLACVKGKTFDLPIYYDLEDSSMTKLGKSTLTKIAKTFCEAIKAGNYRAGIYANPNWFNNYLDYSALKAKYSIWLAQWTSSHTLSCDIWQYSETGQVSGVSGNVDMSIIENTSVIAGGSTNKTLADDNSSYTADAVVALAYSEVGYKEKASNSQLNSKTANAGDNNWNKYAAYIDANCPDFYNGKKNGYDWCDIFHDYLHIKVAGDAEVARKALYQPKKSTGAGCLYSAQFYRDNNAWIKRSGTPKPGDQIFFGTQGNEYHTGVVVKVTDTAVYTVEGNSSEMVAERSYARTNSQISGYGRPNYTGKSKSSANSSTNTSKPASTSVTKKATVPDVTYRVRSGGKWYPAVKNLEDYAGVKGVVITDVAIKVSKGSVKYRVHVKGGSWLSYVTGYNTSDSINGYAGNGSPIDAIEVYYSTPADLVETNGYYRAKYRVSPVNGGYYSYQYDNEKTNEQDGYAGTFGKTIDRIQIILSK